MCSVWNKLPTYIFEECIFTAGLVRPLNPSIHNSQMPICSYNVQKRRYQALSVTQYQTVQGALEMHIVADY